MTEVERDEKGRMMSSEEGVNKNIDNKVRKYEERQNQEVFVWKVPKITFSEF